MKPFLYLLITTTFIFYLHTIVKGNDVEPYLIYSEAADASAAGEYTRALELFARVYMSVPEAHIAEASYINAAETAMKSGNKAMASSLIIEMIALYPEGDFVTDAKIIYKAATGTALKIIPGQKSALTPVQRIEKLIDKGQFIQAAGQLENLLTENPELQDRDKIYMTLAECYEKIGSRKRAAELLGSLPVQSAHKRAEGMCMAARLLSEAGLYSDAYEVLRDMFERFPNEYEDENIQGIYVRFGFSRHEGEPESNIRTADQLKKQAVKKFNDGMKVDAINDMMKLVKESPDDPEPFWLLGYMYWSDGDLIKAEKSLQNAAQRESKLAYMNHLESGLQHIGSDINKLVDVEIDTSKKSAKLSNISYGQDDNGDYIIKNAAQVNNSGVEKWNSGLREEAVELWKKALTIDPELQEAYINIGLYYEGRKNWNELASISRRMISHLPGSAAAFAGLGHSLYRMGEYEQALPVLKRAESLGVNQSEMLQELYPEALNEIAGLIRRCEIRLRRTR